MISRLEAALLGLLYSGPKTGYEMVKTMEAGHLYRSSSPGAIYPALHRLEKAGQIVSKGDERIHHYSLTEKGLADLKDFAGTPVPWTSLFVDQVLLRMKQRSLPLLAPAERRHYIEAQLAEIQQAITASENRRFGLDPESHNAKIVQLVIAHLQLDADFFETQLRQLAHP